MPSKNQSEISGSPTSSPLANITRWFKVQILRADPTIRPSSSKVSASPSSSSSMSSKSKKLPRRARSLSGSKLFNNTKSSDKKNRHGDSFLDEESWVDEELIEDDDLAIFGKDEIYRLSIAQAKPGNITHSTTPLVVSAEQASCTKKDCLKDTHIVRGSVEHFVYVRTLRKIRAGREQKYLLQMVMLNGLMTKLSKTYEFPESQRAEMRHYKATICEIDRRNYPSSRSGVNTSTTEISTTAANKKFAFIAGYNTGSRVVVKYRPSYSSTKVLTVFDEELKRLVVKELPLARRKRRISKSSISSASSTSTLVRSSSNSSMSSLSTLTTLAEPVESDHNKFFDPLKVMSSKLHKLRMSTMNMISIKQHQKSNIVYETNYDNDDGEDDDVSLFVLKEQFRYSGRSCGNTFQRHSSDTTVGVLSVERNDSRLTLAV
ncbi:16028_t:CDS:1 [Acaulospora colombiana]|uniref:16028_t:CDS:1 n=1 Tax=Acaulospora colombiana TaxID=27376 RepID=A0ACA9LSE1_9GLOM|nr:16028_t:CDS:1 [Acaulospora colombiana]